MIPAFPTSSAALAALNTQGGTVDGSPKTHYLMLSSYNHEGIHLQ